MESIFIETFRNISSLSFHNPSLIPLKYMGSFTCWALQYWTAAHFSAVNSSPSGFSFFQLYFLVVLDLLFIFSFGKVGVTDRISKSLGVSDSPVHCFFCWGAIQIRQKRTIKRNKGKWPLTYYLLYNASDLCLHTCKYSFLHRVDLFSWPLLFY